MIQIFVLLSMVNDMANNYLQRAILQEYIIWCYREEFFYWILQLIMFLYINQVRL